MKPSRVAALFLLPLLIGIATSAGDDKRPASPKDPAVDLLGDPLPKGVLMRMGTVRFRHGAQIQQLQYSRDGKVLASQGADQVIRLWETTSGKELQALHVPESVNAPFALSPDGKLIATTNFMRVRIWEVKTGKELHGIDDQNGNNTALVFSPDGKTLAVTSGADEIRLIDVSAGKESSRMKGPQNQGNQGFFHQQLSYSPDGKFLAMQGFRDNKSVVDFIPIGGDSKESRNIELEQQNSAYQMFAPDHKTMAMWGNDQDVHVVDLKNGKDLHKFNMQQGLTSMAYSADGKYLAVGTGNNELLIWDVTTGNPANPQETPKTPVQVMAFSPDGKSLAFSGGTCSVIRIIDFKKGKDIHAAQGHQAAVSQVAVSPNGKVLGTLGEDHLLILWDLTNGKEIRRIEMPADQPGVPAFGTVEFAPDGKHFAVSWSNQPLVLYETATGKEIRTFGDKDNPVGVLNVAFTPDGKSVAGACGDGVVRFWDMRTGKEQRRYPEPTGDPAPPGEVPGEVLPVPGGISLLAFSPNGKLMITLGADIGDNPNNSYTILRVWELATGKERQKIRVKYAGDPNGVIRDQLGLRGGIGGGVALADIAYAGGSQSGMAVSPNGRYVALTMGASIQLIDMVKGKEIRQFGAQGETLSGTAFSPDGKTLAAGASDGTLRFWEVATGTALHEFEGHRGSVTSLVFAPNGKTLVTGGDDTTAMTWDVPYLFETLTEKPVSLTAERALELAKELDGNDAIEAKKAMDLLGQAPKEALPALKARLKPVDAPEPAKINQLIKELGSDDFATRKRAIGELEKLGELAEPALNERLKDSPDLDTQKNIEELLDKLQKPITSPELAGALRMIELLEQIGTPEARNLLEELSRGAEGARITRDAKQAFERLSER
jgi:WD40 repeat protein